MVNIFPFTDGRACGIYYFSFCPLGQKHGPNRERRLANSCFIVVCVVLFTLYIRSFNHVLFAFCRRPQQYYSFVHYFLLLLSPFVLVKKIIEAIFPHAR